MADFMRSGPARPMLAVHARTARVGGVCTLCGKPVRPGDRIADLPADGGQCHLWPCLARRSS
jgi:hypothetical protein